MDLNNNIKITALLTGRGNNTLKDKNVLPVFGKPLLYYPAKAAWDSKYITEYYVSSDCEKILTAAEEIGYSRIKRPLEYARPDSQHEDVIIHALDVLKEKEEKPDIVVIILANNASVKTEWIDDCVKALIDDETLTSAIPVYSEMDHHPFRAKKLNNEGLIDTFFDFKGKKISTNRQDLEPNYYCCHNFWVLRNNNFDNETEGQMPWKFMGDRIKPYVIEQTFDVHESEDIKRVENWLTQNGIV
ncbi:MAG: CMP-N,N'-diacetyllegionaminic acid synthase [Candidatus Paceibacteria bacterium]|jgi:CMP-N,N'-diacetyllegionaminic acid synthase